MLIERKETEYLRCLVMELKAQTRFLEYSYHKSKILEYINHISSCRADIEATTCMVMSGVVWRCEALHGITWHHEAMPENT